MSTDELLSNVLKRFSREGIPGVMTDAPARYTSGLDKGKKLATNSPQVRKSPSHQQQEEERTKFIEEAVRLPQFPEYVNPRLEDDKEPIVLPPATTYELPVLELPLDVKVTEPLLGCIEDLRYAYHDLTVAEKFPRFKPNRYLRTEHDKEVISPVDWAKPIYRSTILNVLRLPHFARSLEVNVVVKFLLTWMHGGYLRMDSRISLDPHLIGRLKHLSKQGIDPVAIFVGKDQDK